MGIDKRPQRLTFADLVGIFFVLIGITALGLGLAAFAGGGAP